MKFIKSRESLTYCLLLSALVLSSCRDPQQLVVLRDALTLPAKQVVDIRSPTPLLTPARSQTGHVCTIIPPPLHIDGTGDLAIVTSEGHHIVPKVWAVRENGQVDVISSRYFRSQNALCFLGLRTELHPPYVAIRIESPESIRVGRITWSSVDL